LSVAILAQALWLIEALFFLCPNSDLAMGNCFAGVTPAQKVGEKKPLIKPAAVEAIPATQAPKAPVVVEKKEADRVPPQVPVVVEKKDEPPKVELLEPVFEPVDMPMRVDQVEGESRISGLKVDSCLEVFSNSYNSWCPGVIQDMDSTSVFVAYQVPGDPAESLINTKGLPINSEELRPAEDGGAWLGASVEVFSSTKQCWCMGKITELQLGVATAIYQYPDQPPESDPIMKQLELGNPDLQLPGAKNALQYRQGVDVGCPTNMSPGTRVEVFSNSMQMWCPGEVQELRPDGSISVAFHYPDMDPEEAPVVKELPLGHQDVRLITPEVFNNAPVSEEELVQGIAVEVYSESRQFWILAHVKEVKDGLVTVLVRYPDMPPETELFEKVLPVGHMYVRLPLGESAEVDAA